MPNVGIAPAVAELGPACYSSFLEVVGQVAGSIEIKINFIS